MSADGSAAASTQARLGGEARPSRGHRGRCSFSRPPRARSAGVLFAYADDLPEISALDDYRPNTITRIHARGRRGHRRVRHRAPRRGRLRRHRTGAATGHHRQRGRRVRAALRLEHLADPHHRGARRGLRPALRRQHDHPAAARDCCFCPATCRGASSSGRRSARSRRSSSPSRSRSATPSARSSRSTPTRSTSDTARTGWRRRSRMYFASRPRTSRSTRPPPSPRSSRRRHG